MMSAFDRSRPLFFVRIVLLLVAASFTGNAEAQQDPTPGVVKFQARAEGDDLQREGSGFIVGFDGRLTFIVTAAHVIEGDSRPKVVFAAAPHLTFEAIPIQIEPAADIAVLKVVGFVPGMIVLPLDERPVAPADPLQAIGFPRRALQPRWITAGASSREGSKIVLDEQLAEGHSGGPLLREGWVVGLVNATEGDFAYATSAPFLGQILESWRVPFQMRSTRKPVISARPAEEPEPELEDDGGNSVQIPVRPQPAPGCFGEVASRTGSGQPVRIAASPSARALLSLPAGTGVAVQARAASSGYTWYQVVFNTASGNQSGWMQADHLILAAGCRL
jgi:trypsin-like peptidase